MNGSIPTQFLTQHWSKLLEENSELLDDIWRFILDINIIGFHQKGFSYAEQSLLKYEQVDQELSHIARIIPIEKPIKVRVLFSPTWRIFDDSRKKEAEPQTVIRRIVELVKKYPKYNEIILPLQELKRYLEQNFKWVNRRTLLLSEEEVQHTFRQNIINLQSKLKEGLEKTLRRYSIWGRFKYNLFWRFLPVLISFIIISILLLYLFAPTEFCNFTQYAINYKINIFLFIGFLSAIWLSDYMINFLYKAFLYLKSLL